MIEAMVSVALLGVGIVAVLGGFAALAKSQQRAVESERMQRLAVDKYQELVGTEAIQTESLSGDFSDRGEDRYVWQATVETTATENLSALNVIVQTRDGGADGPTQFASGVVYVPQTTTTTPTQGTAGGTP
jgi:type II secretory pathway pseudopilin PulG